MTERESIIQEYENFTEEERNALLMQHRHSVYVLGELRFIDQLRQSGVVPLQEYGFTKEQPISKVLLSRIVNLSIAEKDSVIQIVLASGETVVFVRGYSEKLTGLLLSPLQSFSMILTTKRNDIEEVTKFSVIRHKSFKQGYIVTRLPNEQNHQ